MFSSQSPNDLASIESLYFPEEQFSWPSPWWCLESNPKTQLGIQKEINKEIGPQHPLWGLQPVVFAKCDANDDVIAHLNNNTFACIRLVWHGKIDRHPDKYPKCVIFKNGADLQHFLNNSVR